MNTLAEFLDANPLRQGRMSEIVRRSHNRTANPPMKYVSFCWRWPTSAQLPEWRVCWHNSDYFGGEPFNTRVDLTTTDADKAWTAFTKDSW